MLPADRDWHGRAGADEATLSELRGVAPYPLPAAYPAFLGAGDGGEGPLPVEPGWICLDSSAEVIETARRGAHAEFFPGLFVVGGNGAGELVAFDTSGGAFGRLVVFDATNTDPAESVVPLAEDFDALVAMIGVPSD